MSSGTGNEKLPGRRRRRAAFLDAFRLEDDRALLEPDPEFGRAGLLAGHTSDGMPVLVKFWDRGTKSRNSDLEEIWRHELRQLHRLAGYPGAHDLIAPLVQAATDDNGFYLVLDPGLRRPLSRALQYGSANHWLKQPRVLQNRVKMWANLKRVGSALEILHMQGLLHRNIDAWAVLTAGTDDPDFQLTGFEWSMRLTAGITATRITKKQTSEKERYSFQHDWLLFGLLAADILGVNRDRLLDLRIAPFEIAEHISAEEARLLREIVYQDTSEKGGEWIVSQIEQLMRSLNAEVAGVNPKFHLVLRLGSGMPLSGRIREASGNEIETDDLEGQLEFVTADLADSPILMAVRPWVATDPPRLLLRGRDLNYQVREYRHPKEPDVSTWEFAYCESVDSNAPAPVNVLGQRTLEPTWLDLMSHVPAIERYPRLRGKIRSWEELRRQLSQIPALRSKEERFHRALTLTQFLDALYAATDVYPVEIVETPESAILTEEGQVQLWLRPRFDADRDALSKELGLKGTAHRLEDALVGENVSSEGWILTDSRSLGDKKPTDSDWEFQQRFAPEGIEPVYVFTGTAYVPLLSDAFLVPAASVGRDVQFRRRLKALRSLKDHVELLRMLSDPRQRILETHEKVDEDAQFATLDKPKQEALQELTNIVPFYMVQGPPGVGKTRLVRDLVTRRFIDEPSSRLLLSAQSNSAIDHLMDELSIALSSHPAGTAEPLVVRCRSRESTAPATSFEIGVQAEKIASALETSAITKSASSKLQHRIRQLAATLREGKGSASGHTVASSTNAMRAFESLIVRSANVVFSTTNSSELERLIDEKSQFDWTIIEEAGKATGGELVSPMLLSHRRLMIGDHKQLPAFGVDRISELLKAPEKVKQALIVGEEFIGRSLRDPTTEEIIDTIEDGETDLPSLCADSLEVLTLFESLIETEFARQKRGRGGRSIAKRLTAQHRMHPEIARLVSRCFYDRELITDENRIEYFRDASAPFLSSDQHRLPNSPIVAVDMAYVQEQVGQKKGDQLPRWNNEDEVTAVLEVLSLLRARNGDKPPSISVLSPYLQQVHRINSAIDEQWNTRLSHLSEFSHSVEDGGICKTVDSFQGSEADVVVVSLVRNNAHSNVRNALGFISDFRRMNVLLSRARWQLVLVGSLRFLHHVILAAKGTKDEHLVVFLKEMLAELQEGQQRNTYTRIPFTRLMGTE